MLLLQRVAANWERSYFKDVSALPWEFWLPKQRVFYTSTFLFDVLSEQQIESDFEETEEDVSIRVKPSMHSTLKWRVSNLFNLYGFEVCNAQYWTDTS